MSQPIDPSTPGAHSVGDHEPALDPSAAPPAADRSYTERPTVVDHAATLVQPVIETVPAETRSSTSTPDPADRTSILRVPTFSPVAPIVGLLTAWGAIVVAVAILTRVGLGLGINLGIASGGPGDDGFWPGIWLLVVNGGGFLLGGYTAARLARANGTRHAVAVWLLAMAATAADALVNVIQTGDTGTIKLLPGVPFWADTNLTSTGQAIAVLAIFAGAALVGAIVGGGFGQTANRIDRTDDAVIRT